MILIQSECKLNGAGTFPLVRVDINTKARHTLLERDSSLVVSDASRLYPVLDAEPLCHRPQLRSSGEMLQKGGRGRIVGVYHPQYSI